MIKNSVSVIIPCFNAVKYTRQCVKSVLLNTNYSYELILINNGSSDSTEQYFSKLKASVKPVNGLQKLTVIQLKRNIGVAGALNLGISKSAGMYVCYLNNDVIVTMDWLGKMVRACRENAYNAVVGTLFNSFEDEQFAAEIEKDKSRIDEISKIISLINKNKIKKSRTIHGLCMLVKKKIFAEVGLFNANIYPCFGEDIEFCERVKKRGYNLIDALDVFIFHYWNKSVRSKEFIKQNKSIECVMQKHYENFGISKKYKI